MYVISMGLIATAQPIDLVLKLLEMTTEGRLDWLRNQAAHKDDIHVIVYLGTNPKMTDIQF